MNKPQLENHSSQSLLKQIIELAHEKKAEKIIKSKVVNDNPYK